jgi:hypothetical protein
MRGRRKGPVYRGLPKSTAPKSLRRAGVSFVVLAVISLTAGIGYTFYADRKSSVTLASTPYSATTPQLIKPKVPPANAKVGVAVETFSSLVKPGSDASISVRTTSGSTCKIDVRYNNLPAHDPGLTPQTADDFGTASWTWTVSPATPTGMWPVKITCSRGGQSGVVQVTLAVNS